MPDNGDPTWAQQARRFYDLLWEYSMINEYGQRIFTGKLRDVYNATGASNASYTRIRKLLIELGVIRIVQRGNRHQLSVVEITGELPPSDLLPPGHLTERTAAATMVVEVERQVKSLTAWRESLLKGGLDIAEVLKDFELRLTRLEREVRKIGSQA